ncbi:AbgT family transporter [Geosporobacter ferrireducens]|uniref:Aminobenzoyl-glutamate transporter n=1 Tax=Geosporobacter ferrireducens TaxID=1424294 RepID=A0A1D8GH66_9FIRM|nr:AbgT family transporter [Geosporobacter ferrireducens]AOT70257.1 aminobenzoyl-glutamate transporter [Geosporobacter ferrireducens]MTI55782.1 AbgT family transporter [Geosporobacter ferrireducens]
MEKVKVQNTKKKGLFNVFLNMIEKVGNKLPHPVTLFVLFSIAVIIISDLAARAGVFVEFTMVDAATKEVKLTTVQAISLLNADGIRYMFSKAVSNFTGFAPLGTVLVAMLGVGVAEGTGLIQAALRKLVLSTPKGLITAVVVFAGVMSNVASDAGYVVLVPLGAIVFLSFGRHPLAGLAAAFAGVSGGFSANLLVGTIDPLLGGISTEAAKLFSPGYTVAATANWYFMIASTFLITILGTLITEKIVEPRLGEYKGSAKVDLHNLTSEEKKGLAAAGVALLLYVVAIAAMVVPANGILRDPEAGTILGHSPFMDGIVPIIALFFLIPGIVYGIFAKTVKNDKDIAAAMGKAMSTMGGYLVLAFAAAQFVSYFGYTKLGTILAVKGADFLKATGMTGFPLIIGFIIVSAFINLFIGSASAKWAIMAPVFVPMLMAVGYSPEFTQVAYRIGDSTTNIISPLMSYFAVIVAFAEKYDEEAGIGTLISTMVPYSIVFLLGWSILLVAWYFLGWQLGPGVTMFLQ